MQGCLSLASCFPSSGVSGQLASCKHSCKGASPGARLRASSISDQVRRGGRGRGGCSGVGGGLILGVVLGSWSLPSSPKSTSLNQDTSILDLVSSLEFNLYSHRNSLIALKEVFQFVSHSGPQCQQGTSY